jgi:hypothetical protein
LSFICALFITTFITSYSGIRATEALSYHAKDGWCDPNVEGFGEHCFGDFYAPLASLKEDSPYEGIVRNYPPFAFAILKPFAILHSNLPGKLSLILYLALSLTCLIFPVLHLLIKKKIFFDDLPLALGAVLLSGPSITLLDRGNILAFCIPFIYLFFYHLKYTSNHAALKYGVIFTLIKPQLFLLSMMFTATRKFKLVMYWVFLDVLISLASFIFFPTDALKNIGRWVNATLSYSNVGAIGVLEPVNVSLKSSIDVIFNALGHVAPQAVLTIINYLVFLISTFIFVKFFNSRSNSYNMLLALLFPILFVGTTYHYYLSILVIPLLFLIAEHKSCDSSKVVPKLELLNDKLRFRVLLLYIFLLTPFVIPWSTLGFFDGRGWENISIHWLVVQLVLSATGLSLYFQNFLNLKRSLSN